ncbi:serine/threonine protein kinase [Paenibacillus senegalensis]|uniref:serine/threonine protein kinase n=1 Tax=Paenibacillus senegalensis TaxID=1465766 RepID=UPI000288E009|nr:serine/threonine-protein kinase [Paenibacillus senegalensis]
MPSNRFLPLKIGEVLAGRYRILSIAGYGGMSVVYQAQDLKLPGKHWAVKAARGHRQSRQAFTEEAEFLSRLTHPHLPLIIDFIPPNEQGISYLVMEFIAGQTLQQRFEHNKQVPCLAVIRYAKQLCDLFSYLHQYQPNPIIYRDLKPSNVMLDEQDNIRLIDFGIARNFRQDRGTDTVQLGTIGFAAPEQFLNRQTDERTDLYTLGAMMYYLLSEGRHYMDTGENLARWNEQLPPALVDLIHLLLKEQPADRIQTAEEVKKKLQEIERTLTGSRSTKENARTNLAKRLSSSNRKLVIVGGLYSGAGATTVAVSAARVAHYSGFSNAVIEHVIVEPELESLLYGDKNKPRNYRYYTARFSRSKMLPPSAWKSGNTEWLPLPPSHLQKYGTGERWTKEHYFRLFYELDHALLFLDVASHWRDPDVRELCYAADCLLVIGSPHPVKWSGRQAKENMKILRQLQSEGVVIHWGANPYLPFRFVDDWLNSYPQYPILRMPHFPLMQILDKQWEGRLLQDDDELLTNLTEAMAPFLHKLDPALVNRGQAAGRISTWFKRKLNR